MKCTSCSHRIVCVHKKTIENFVLTSGIKDLVIIGVQECAFSNISDMNEIESVRIEPEQLSEIQYDKNEDVIKDFTKRSEMIKNSYRDVNGSDLICPNCKSKVQLLNKCIDCGKPVCPECGVTVSVDLKDAGLMCQECWVEMMEKDDEAQKNAVQLDVNDNSFLKNVVRQDIPRDK